MKVSIQLSEYAEAQLIILKHDTGQKTIGDTIRKSLSLFIFLVEEVQKGNKIILRNNKTGEEKELILDIK